MSLVERALKKIHESRANAPAKPDSTVHLSSGAANSHARIDRTSIEIAPIPAHDLAEAISPTRTLHIDRDALRAAQILPSAQQERQLADEYRQIKRPLIANARIRGVEKLINGHLIMMASALPGDGKTFTSVNLALSMAQEKDTSVVLIDADVAKPHVSQLFGLHGERGLLDVLRDETLNVESVILPTDVPGLSVLPSGKHSDNATELLASARMEQVLAQISVRDPNRIVLLDSPPLLLTSESRVLASLVGQIVLVVRSGVTPQHAVLDALDLLGEGKSIGLVLNQSDEASRSGYYDYYGQYAGNKALPT